MDIRNVKEIILHHTGSMDTPEAVERYHRLGVQDDLPGRIAEAILGNDKPYSDVGYHFMISDDGSIYAGRNLAFKGAHVRGHNTNTIGIAFLGDHTSRPVSTAALAAFGSLQSSLELMSGNQMTLSTHGYYDTRKRSEMIGALQQFNGAKAPTVQPRPLPTPPLPLNRATSPRTQS